MDQGIRNRGWVARRNSFERSDLHSTGVKLCLNKGQDMFGSKNKPLQVTEPQRQDVSGAVTSVIVRYVRQLSGDEGVIRMLQLARDTRPVQLLEDPTSWSSYAEALRLFEGARAVTGDPAVAMHIGEEMLRQHQATEVGDLFRSLGSPGRLLSNVARAAAKFSTTEQVDALEVGNAHAVVKAMAKPGFRRSLYMCDFDKGLLSQIPVLFGLVPAVVTESECQARGGRFCLYSLSWEERQWSNFVDQRGSLYTAAWAEKQVVEARSELDLTPEEKIAQLEEHLRVVTKRLEDVYATAADLLSEEDIEALLARITTRAARAVNAPRYLLTVQTTPSSKVQMHQHGFTSAEASSLVNELSKEHPDDHGGSHLIVEVESRRRHYGKLAAVYPEGTQFFAQEKRILAVYANYAATALDVITALDDSRRQNATTQALLDFASSLTGATSQQEVSRQLSTVLQKVTGARDTSVYIHSPTTQRLTLVAEGSDSEHQESLDKTEMDQPFIDLADPANANLRQKLFSAKTTFALQWDAACPGAKVILGSSINDIALITPIISMDNLLGISVIKFENNSATAILNREDLLKRLAGLSDQASTALLKASLLEQISHMAWHDALTGLPNRRLLEDRVEQALARSQRSGESITMFFVDLDRFKNVNDTLGHAAGDELIKQVANRLVEATRRQDTVARLGGDEFAILLPGLGDKQVIDELAKRLLVALGRPFILEEQEVYVSGSIGVSIAPEHGQSYDELISHADAAMYKSKERGRNTFSMFDTTLETTKTHTMHIEVDMHHGLEREEFFILYQPLVDLRTNSPIGVEALVRWHHPELGTLEPENFLPAAEESELIVRLDQWVLRTATKQLVKWQRSGFPQLHLAVNISWRDLVISSFKDLIQQILEESAIDPSTLELEITERVIIDEDGIVESTIQQIKQMGVRFAIDDFGTGNSSLAMISRLPFDTLKIDKSFIEEIGERDPEGALVGTIISMATSLGFDCIAEGVETNYQKDLLLRHGCNKAQGLYFSPPLPSNEIEPLLKNLTR